MLTQQSALNKMPYQPPTKVLSLEECARRIGIIEKQLAQLAQSFGDWENSAKRMREQWISEHADMTEGAKRTMIKAIEDGLAPLSSYADQVRAIHTLTKEQTTLLEDAAKERHRRIAKEELAAEELRDEELAGKRHARKITTWGVIISLITIVAGLISAAIASHH